MRLKVLVFTAVFFWLAAIPLVLPADLAPKNIGVITGHSGQEGSCNLADPISIRQVIESAVTDNSWLYCTDRRCLYDMLARYYTGPLLERLTDECLQFNQLHTDWYSVATVSRLTIIGAEPPRSYAMADIIYVDIITGRAYQGQGEFELLLTRDGWRIELVTYNWQ